MHLRLRENVLTGELYFVFVRDNTPDSIKVPIGRGENKCISVFNKGLVDFLMKSLNIKREEAPDYLLDIGDNKSRMENAVVLQISKK